MEVWKQIVGFEGFYSVSSNGKIRRDVPSRGFGSSAAVGRILKLKKTANGYINVSIYPETGKQRQIGVHCLVATAFLGAPPSGKVVNHKDGNKANNNLSNLEYLTQSENIKHAYTIGLIKPMRGEQNPMAVLNNEAIKAIKVLAKDHNWSKSSLARAFRTDTARIKRILSGKIWRSSEDTYPLGKGE